MAKQTYLLRGTDAEMSLWKSVAAARGESFSVFIRSALNQSAQVTDKAVVAREVSKHSDDLSEWKPDFK